MDNVKNEHHDTAPNLAEPPAYQPYLVRVSRKQRLSPHFMRIVFKGDELDHFGTDGLDQRIKVMLPMTLTHPGVHELWADPLLFDPESVARNGWWDQWRALPTDRRNVFRTYTVRTVNQSSKTVTIDFVLHDGAGPAGTFARDCASGDPAVLIGPNARSRDSAIGIEFHPRQANSITLIGDETAVPAISSILEGLSGDLQGGAQPQNAGNIRAETFLEVPSEDDFLALVTPHNTSIHWLARDDMPRAQKLIETLKSQAVTDTMISSSDYYWLAGEAALVQDVRRLLVNDFSVDKKHIAFMGYWRNGVAEI